MIDALRALASLEVLPRKLLLIVDGLDEFEGDLQSSIDLFQTLGTNPRIKLLLSSRPIGAYSEAFSKCPSLRMQDLTKGDMSIYVSDKIGKHSYVLRLERRHPGALARLKDDLLNKACGVFLWTVLACRSLLHGFTTCAKLSDLQRRVDDLPPELEDLFKHILTRGNTGDSITAAKLLRMAFTNKTTSSQNQICALSLARLDDNDLKLVPLPAEAEFSNADADELLHDFNRRLLAYCGGLLEINNPITRECIAGDVSRKAYVQFMHRTVFEFLSTPTVMDLKCMQIHDNTFDPNALVAFLLLDSVRVIGQPRRGTNIMCNAINGCLLQASFAQSCSWRGVRKTLNRLLSLPIFSGTRRRYSAVAAESKASLDVILAVEAGLCWYLKAHPAQQDWGDCAALTAAIY